MSEYYLEGADREAVERGYRTAMLGAPVIDPLEPTYQALIARRRHVDALIAMLEAERAMTGKPREAVAA